MSFSDLAHGSARREIRRLFDDAIAASRASVRLTAPLQVQGLFTYVVGWVALMVLSLIAFGRSLFVSEDRLASAAVGLACAVGSFLAMVRLAWTFRQDTSIDDGEQ